MLLAVDIGNSHIVIGCIEDQTVKSVYRIVTDSNKTEDQYFAEISSIFEYSGIQNDIFSGAIVSSVVPSVTMSICETVHRLTGHIPFLVGSGIKTGLNIRIENASELGADAVCVSVAALAKYGAPCAVVDMGTATKILVCDKDGVYIGGCICPGVTISADALKQRASLLPSVSIEAPKRAVTGVTIDAIKSGIVFGAAAMVDGLLERFESELGYKLNVIATGGVSKRIIPHCKSKIIIDENLILDGLRILYEKNRKQ